MIPMIPLFLAALLAFSSETIKGAQKDFEKVKQELNLQLKQVENKLEELKTNAAQKSTAAKEQAIKEAEETRTLLRSKIDSLKDDGKNNWKKIKSSLADSIESMNTKIQKALKD